MNPRRIAMMAAVLCETAFVACFAGFGSTRTENENAGAGLIIERLAPALAANVEVVDAPRASAVGNIAVDDSDIATVAKTSAVTEAAPAPAPDEPASTVKVASVDGSEILTQETPSVQAPPASMPDAALGDAGQSVSTIEILDECFVVDVCIDRYLWALYQRTPKEDTIKVDDQRKVTVKRKGKLVTVTRTFTKLVDENFAWKDPKAADKAGMTMTDYVIGGMDRSFKLKLFHVLYAAEQAASPAHSATTTASRLQAVSRRPPTGRIMAAVFAAAMATGLRPMS